MANKRESKMDGMPEIIEALKNMGVSLETKEMQDMLKREAQPIIETARRLAPNDTGNLRQSIQFITRMDKQNRTKVLIGPHGNWYNHYLGVMFEYGTVSRIQEKTGRYTGMIEARPFMRPALDQNAGKVTDGIINGVDKILAKLAKKNNLIYK
jgi:HK97 gp10 family phage protein